MATDSYKQHLVVFRLSAMGDVALMAPVLKAVLNQYPLLSITLVSLEKWLPIFKDIPRLAFLIAAPKQQHKGLKGLWRLSREIKACNAHGFLDLHNVLRSKIIRLFLGFNRLPVAVINKGRAEKKALTRLKNKTFVPLKHSTERYAEVFASLGFTVTLDSSAILSKPTPIKTTSQQAFIGIAPFAAHRGKQYPLVLLKQAIDLFLLAQQKKYQIVFFGGGAQESEIIKTLCATYSKSVNCLSLSFAEELSCISQLELMLAMDSGNAHLAAMYGVPTLTLWGNTHPYAGFYPFLQPQENALLADRKKYPAIPTSVFGKKVPKGYENVMESVPPAAVAEKMLKILDKTSANGQNTQA